jgi:hypothetical protein
MEDDLITSPNFLDFMNLALDYYSDYEQVFSISGFGYKIKKQIQYPFEVYFTGRPSSWGWATWQNRWATIDWKIKDYSEFMNNSKKIKLFNDNGSDMFQMLENSINGKNNSWAIRFAYNQFKQNKLTMRPFLSKVRNTGFDQDATHCKQYYNRYKVDFDSMNSREFVWDNELVINQSINRQLREYNSITNRLKSKLINIFFKWRIIK